MIFYLQGFEKLLFLRTLIAADEQYLSRVYTGIYC